MTYLCEHQASIDMRLKMIALMHSNSDIKILDTEFQGTLF